VLCFSGFTDNCNAHQIISSAAGGGGLPLLIPENTNHKLQLHATSSQLVNLGGGWGDGGGCGE
jgi:hypothetical protein